MIEVITNENLFGCSLFRHSQLAKLVTPSFYTLSMEARATRVLGMGIDIMNYEKQCKMLKNKPTTGKKPH